MLGLLIKHSLKFYENGSLHFIYYCEVQPLQMILVGLVKATEGGLRVKNEVMLFFKISWSSCRAGCKKPHQKILFLAGVINF